MPDGSIQNREFEKYSLHLAESSRPPSRGGNTGALHQHVLTIDGERYSFLALGSQQWAFKSDTVSFDFELKNGYRNIVESSFVALDKNGQPVVRGNRGFKTRLRSAPARAPGSRREQRD